MMSVTFIITFIATGVFWIIYALTGKHLKLRNLSIVIFAVANVCAIAYLVVPLMGYLQFGISIFQILIPVSVAFLVPIVSLLCAVYLSFFRKNKAERAETNFKDNEIFQLVLDLVIKEQPESFTVTNSQVSFETGSRRAQSIRAIDYSEYGYEEMPPQIVRQFSEMLQRELSEYQMMQSAQTVGNGQGTECLFRRISRENQNSGSSQGQEALKKWQ